MNLWSILLTYFIFAVLEEGNRGDRGSKGNRGDKGKRWKNGMMNDEECWLLVAGCVEQKAESVTTTQPLNLLNHSTYSTKTTLNIEIFEP
jgi:hypothetical protein